MVEDMTGRRFGRLSVLGRFHRGKRAAYWWCRCDCGNEVAVNSHHLRVGKTKSCGCLKNELSSERMTRSNYKHGKSRTRLHRIWVDMRKRCSNSNHWAYQRYGGRGIFVCDEWSNFESFEQWSVRNGYSETLTLDRENNNGPYSPENCRWVSRKEQSRNRCSTILLEYKGECLPLSEWAEKLNMKYSTLYGRIYHYGWSIEKALSTDSKGGDCHGTTRLSV